MPDTTLNLGDFQFASFEIPEQIGFGGEQKLVVHELVGGKRVLDAMGETPQALEWSGIFVGQSSLDRALYIDGLRKAGKQLELTWSALRYTVVIKSFHCDFVRFYRLPYHITCEVVSDDTAPITTIAADSLEQKIADDQDAADALAAKVGSSGLIAAVSRVRAGLAKVKSFVAATREQINGVLQPIREARAEISALMVDAASTLNSVATVGGIFPQSPVAAQADHLASQIVALSEQSDLVVLNTTLGRMAVNIGGASGGVRTALVAGGNLYAVAAKEYGDAMGWTAIARANGASDPEISGATALTIPPLPSGADGILNA